MQRYLRLQDAVSQPLAESPLLVSTSADRPTVPPLSIAEYRGGTRRSFLSAAKKETLKLRVYSRSSMSVALPPRRCE